MPLLDQSAAFNISFTVTLDIAALVEAAALVEWALNADVSIPASCRQDFSHLTIVLGDTGLCCPIKEWIDGFPLCPDESL